MTTEDFEKILSDFENPSLEFRQDIGMETDKDRDIKTICAFANTRGGRLIFGVREDGANRKVIGLERPPQVLELSLTNKIRAKTNVDPFPEFEFIKSGGHDCVVLHCKKGTKPPYTANDKVYIRRGSTSVEATGAEIAALYHSHSEDADRKIIEEAGLEDLNIEMIKEYLEEREGRQILNGDFNKLLCRMGYAAINVSGEIKPTMAGLLLFGNTPHLILPHAQIRAEVKYDESANDWDDIAEITGNIFDQIKAFDQFVKRNLKVSAVIEGFERTERPAVPPKVLREAIMNALAHRDYQDKGSSIHFRILGNKVIVDSPGGLISPLTIESILAGNFIPKTRNSIIAQTLFDKGFIDQRGTGFTRMIRIMEDFSLPHPEFSDLPNGFRVAFSTEAVVSKKNTIVISPAILKQAKLTDEHKKILKYIEEEDSIKAVQCEQLLNKSKPTAVARLNELIKKGLIQKEGGSGSTTSPLTVYVLHKKFSTENKELSTPLIESGGNRTLFDKFS